MAAGYTHGLARLSVSEKGRVEALDVIPLPAGSELTTLTFPLVIRGLLSRREIEVRIEFDPPVRA